MTDLRLPSATHIPYHRRGVMFSLPECYAVERRILGKGAYGEVRRGVYTAPPPGARKTIVAIKRTGKGNNALVYIRALREIILLRHFRHENIISILDLPVHTDPSDEAAVYVVQEYMPIDLERALVVQELSDEHVSYLMYQLLRGLKAIHSADVVHRDIKPSNILVNEACELKICDFNMARRVGAVLRPSLHLTEYVATRWYRAPEVMMNPGKYSTAVDVWSAGCVLAQMLSGKPLFTGKNTPDQLRQIFQVIGRPGPEQCGGLTSADGLAWIKKNCPETSRIHWESQFPRANPLALSLLDMMLVFDPRQRITASDALRHDYLLSHHDPEDEPVVEPAGKHLFYFEEYFGERRSRHDREERERRDEAKDLLEMELQLMRAEDVVNHRYPVSLHGRNDLREQCLRGLHSQRDEWLKWKLQQKRNRERYWRHGVATRSRIHVGNTRCS